MKKRLSKLALLAVAAAFVLVGFPACGDDDDGEDPPAVLTDIAVEAQPTKTTYKINDNFDPAGLIIKAVYSDGTSDDITYSEDNKAAFAFTGFDASKPSETVTVTVTYKGNSATFTVTVAANEPDPNKTITGISVETPPTKTTYTVGDDTLDPAGLVITVTYSDDNKTDPIAYSEANKDDFKFTGFTSTEPNESVTVTVTYKGKETTFTVSVAEAEKSLFETLSAQKNNILTEDFTAFTVSPFGVGFGKVGVYGADGVTVSDGAISTGAKGTNRKIYVDFGPVKEIVEGCVTLTVGGEQPQSGKNLLTFYDGDTAFLTIKTGTGVNSVGGIAGTYEIYYKFDLTAKTVSLKVNDTDVLTDSTLSVDSVSGYMIESHNSGKGTVAADDIAVCATKADLGTYKAQVKAWLETLVTNSYSEEKGYTTNKAAVAQAKNNGDSAIDAAADIAAVLAAYGNAKTALGQVKNDVTQAQENACTELDAYFPTDKTAESYTNDQLKAVTEAKEAGKTAINAASSVEAVNTALADAKAKIDALPDDSATAYTVTVKDSDGNELKMIDAYKNVASVLDEIKKAAAVKNKVIKDNKFYADEACTSEYDTATELTEDVTVYVTLEESPAQTYKLSNTSYSKDDNNVTKIDDVFSYGKKAKTEKWKATSYEPGCGISDKLGDNSWTLSGGKLAKDGCGIIVTTTGKATFKVWCGATATDYLNSYLTV